MKESMTQPLQDESDPTTEQVKSDIKRLVEGFDLSAMAQSLDQFGRKHPVGLAIAALGIGLGVGLLMRSVESFDTPRE